MHEKIVGCSPAEEQEVAKVLHDLTFGVHWESGSGWEVHAQSCTTPTYEALMHASSRALFPAMSEVEAQRLAVDVWERAREEMPGVALTIRVEASDGVWAARS